MTEPVSQQGISIDKTWAAIKGDEILLEEDTRPELEQEMQKAELPADYDVVALPKPYRSVIV